MFPMNVDSFSSHFRKKTNPCELSTQYCALRGQAQDPFAKTSINERLLQYAPPAPQT